MGRSIQTFVSINVRPIREYFTHKGTSRFACEELQILGLCSAFTALEEGDLYRALPTVTRDLYVHGRAKRIAQFSRLLR